MNGQAAPPIHPGPTRTRLTAALLLATVMSLLTVVVVFSSTTRAYAAIVATVPLGTAGTYSVLGGQTVTNTGPSVLSGDLGVSPGNAITGFPPGEVLGSTHAGDAVAKKAQEDATIAYNNAAGRRSNFSIPANLGGSLLIGGVYTAATSAQLTGTLTLDGQNNPNSVFIFQIGSTLTTASNSSISLIRGAQACNVFFQVGSSATLGTGTNFVGTILALASVTVNTGATVDGRALARNGAVTLDDNFFRSSACIVATPTPSASPSPSDSPAPSDSSTPPPVSPTPPPDSPTPPPDSPTPPPDSSTPPPDSSTPPPDSPTPPPDSSTPPPDSSTPPPDSSTPPPDSSTPPISTSTSSAEVSDIETSSASAIAGSVTGYGDAGGSLARTGSSNLMLLMGLGGIALVLAAGTSLAISRTRYGRRH